LEGLPAVAFGTIAQDMHRRSAALLLRLEDGLPRIMKWWFGIALAASALRILISPLHRAPDLSTVLPYLLLVTGPLVSMGFALTWFQDGDAMPAPARRFSPIGRWLDVPLATARRHPLFGTSGIMVSLLVGMLLNVPVRALEYLAAMPALAGPVPEWLSTLRFAMTLDVVLLSSLYTIAFVAALKRAPIFPRLLATVWIIDLAMQIGIARAVTAAGGLPPAVGEALHSILDGNVTKVLISVALWLPYLLMSRRVNITYRRRIKLA
jgi:hypothetical protein